MKPRIAPYEVSSWIEARMRSGDLRDAERMRLCNAYVNSAATCAAERHAYLAFGRDIRV